MFRFDRWVLMPVPKARVVNEYFSNLKDPKGDCMAKNHYSTKPKRRNRSGKRKDSRRIAANMAKIRELERGRARTE
jgi:hypothetical protein